MKLQAPLNIFVCFKMEAAKSSNLVLHIYKVISNQIKKGKKEKKYTNHHVSLTNTNKFSVHLFVWYHILYKAISLKASRLNTFCFVMASKRKYFHAKFSQNKIDLKDQNPASYHKNTFDSLIDLYNLLLLNQMCSSWFWVVDVSYCIHQKQPFANVFHDMCS